MNIKEALEQFRETSTQFMVAIEGVITFIGNSGIEIEEIANTKEELERSLVDLQSQLSTAQENHLAELNKMAENIENARKNHKESLRVMKEQFNQEVNDANTVKGQKISELDSRLNELSVNVKNLSKEIIEKERFLGELNQSIEAIKSKLNR